MSKRIAKSEEAKARLRAKHQAKKKRRRLREREIKLAEARARLRPNTSKTSPEYRRTFGPAQEMTRSEMRAAIAAAVRNTQSTVTV